MIILDTTEQKRQKDLERLRNFRPMDDDFMCCLFKDNIPLAELVLRIILSDEVLPFEKIAEYVRFSLDEVKKLQAEQIT